MKKLFTALALLLLTPLPLWAQSTAVVSGNLQDLGAVSITSPNTYVEFTLRNFGSNMPRVSGSAVIAQTKKRFNPDSNGDISGNVYTNQSITPSGTFYRVCIFDNGRRLRCDDYSITNATFDLTSAIPLTTSPTASRAGDAIFQNHEHTQAAAATTWTITHSFGVPADCHLYDNSRDQIFPDLGTRTTNTTYTALFVVAQAGTATCKAAGVITLTGTLTSVLDLNPSAAQTGGSGQTFTWDGVIGPVDSSDGLGTDVTPWSNSFFLSPELATSLVLEQTTGDYTITWDDPAAARALSIPDPGATAVFMLTEGAQTINGTNTFSAQVVSSLATGTAPFSIASTTVVTNLNVDQLDGADWAAPAGIGSGTPSTGVFTTLTANTSLTSTIMNLPEGAASNVPHWLHKRVDSSDMTAAATADTFTLFTLPAFTMIHDVVGRLLNPWSGGTISAAVCSIGTAAGADNDLALNDDMFAAAGVRYELHDATANGGKGTLLFDATDKFAPRMFTAGGVIEIQCDLTGDNHANATAGLVRVYLLVSQPLANTATESN